jgi:hypothetical protein
MIVGSSRFLGRSDRKNQKKLLRRLRGILVVCEVISGTESVLILGRRACFGLVATLGPLEGV